MSIVLNQCICTSA